MQTTTGKTFWAGLMMAAIILAVFAQGAEAARKPKKPAKPSELYIQQGKKIIKLTPGDLTFRTVLTLGEDIKAGIYGIPQDPAIKAEIQPLEIRVFDPETAGDKVHLTKLAYVETNPASRFDLSPNKLGPDNFKKTFRMDPEEAVPINLWCVEREIPLLITAVPQKPGWFSLVPKEALAPGNYAVNNGCLDGPRLFTGEHQFYPFALVTALPAPPPAKKALKKARKKRAKPKEEVVLAAPQPRPAPEAPLPAAAPELAAGFTYRAALAKSPRTRREYQITNLDDHAWHNVRIKIYAADNKRFVLGPVTQEKDIVLPGHTVNQPPDKTFMHYETLDDAGYKIYLEISAKEGELRKAWKNIPSGDFGESNLVEVPWDADE